MKKSIFVAVLTLLAFDASAQETMSSPAASGGNSLGAGQWSLSMSIPAGGNPYAAGAFGLWYGLGPEMNLGINVGLGIDTAPEEDVFNLLLAPALKYYFAPGSEITPFFIGQLNLGVTTVGDDAIDFGLLAGFGAEWFVTPIFSVAGYTGIGLDILRPNETDPFRLGTFTSGFSAQLYF